MNHPFLPSRPSRSRLARISHWLSSQASARWAYSPPPPKLGEKPRLGLGRIASVALWLGPLLHGAEFPEWAVRAPVRVEASGLTRLQLSAGVLDASRADLADLRLADPGGREVPLLLRPIEPSPTVRRPVVSFRPILSGSQTVLTLETGTDVPLDAVVLQTPERGFIKAVRVEGSKDGSTYQLLAEGLPIFQQAGAHERTLRFPAGIWTWLRLSIDDERTRAVAFTGAEVQSAATIDTPEEPVAATVTSRDEADGNTRLVLDLGGAHFTLATLELQTSEPLFQREVSLRIPELADDEIREVEVATGTVYSMGVGTRAEFRRTAMTVNRQIPGREVILLIRNGDSPPLPLSGIRLTRRPIEALFHATGPGAYLLYTGHTRSPAPRYDLAGLAAGLSAAPAVVVTPGPLEPNPAYRAPETLPGLAELAATLDPKAWRFRKTTTLRRPGVQQLELDADVVSRAQANWSDLRLVRGDRQVPYLIERPSLTRGLAPEVSVVPDPRNPSRSRWKLTLSHSNLPLTRLECRTRTALFQRTVRVWEEVPDGRGGRYERELGQAHWQRTAGDKNPNLSLAITTPPRTATLFVETDNGDNPPLELESFRVVYPVTRLVFKSAEAPMLYYGNPHAVAPRYDVALVAGHLMAADKSVAEPGAEEVLKPAPWSDGEPLTGVRGWIFWGVLALVVAGLLTILARLVPQGGDASGT